MIMNPLLIQLIIFFLFNQVFTLLIKYNFLFLLSLRYVGLFLMFREECQSIILAFNNFGNILYN